MVTVLHSITKPAMVLRGPWRGFLRQDPPPHIDVQDRDQIFTPLMNAVYSHEDSEGKVRLLLDHGADRDLKDEDGDTALTFARRNNNPAAVIDMLENYRPDVSR